MCDNFIFSSDAIDDSPDCYNCQFDCICHASFSIGFYAPGELSVEDAAFIREQRNQANRDYEF